MRIVGGKLRLSASDVSNFLACRYLSHLDALKARRLLDTPRAFDVGFQDIVARGEEHERNVLAELESRGLSVCRVEADDDHQAAAETRRAIGSGVDVIFQAVLTQPPTPTQLELYGRPDFLVRAGALSGVPSSTPASATPDVTSYEVVDAKLARSAKARAALQTTFYSALLAEAQGSAPENMYLALGNGDFVPFKVHEFAAYERQTRRLLQQLIAHAATETTPPEDPYPEPVEHCAICRWSSWCASKRRRDDDLSLVANMPARHRQGVKGAGEATRVGFSRMDPLPELDHVGGPSLQQHQLQARLQVRSDEEGAIAYELLDPERDEHHELVPNRGLLALPEPAEGDLFFDIEGARYWSDDGKEFGLQYLFGIVDTADVDDQGEPRYHEIWAFDRPGEKEAFETLVDFITERRTANPGLHVYHYNHYEPTSVDHLTELHQTREEIVGRLMGRFATREGEVDDLFRRSVFVDLYRVVRQSLRAGVESYSIKRLEPLVNFVRQVELQTATENLIAFETSLDAGTAASDDAHRTVVAGYNEDDCRATLALRDWLEERRLDLASRLSCELPRPVSAAPEEKVDESEASKLRTALLEGLPTDASTWTAEDCARELVANLLEWHRREAKPAWWRYFRLRELTDAELVREPDSLGELTGGDIVGTEKRSVLRRFTFPPQEHRISAGKGAVDPASGVGWTVVDVDDEHGSITLKIGKQSTKPLPRSLIPDGPPDAGILATRLLDLGHRVANERLLADSAVGAFLLKRPLREINAVTGTLQAPGETPGDAAVRLVTSVDRAVLSIQGPPGTGKTHTAARQIVELVSLGRTVGITAPSHAVICNLVDAVFRHAADLGAKVRVGQRVEADDAPVHAETERLAYDALESRLADHSIDIVAGTAWLWAKHEFQDSVDTLFVDEAGQFSLANVVAVAGAARNVVLLGDPQQLAQPSQAAHPPGAGASALEHVIGDAATMPPEAGLLLDETWRMHPDLCRFTSENFYDSRLSCVPGLELQEVLGAEGDGFSGSGLRLLQVVHEGNMNASPEEASAVAELVSSFLTKQWRDRTGVESAIGLSDILVVTPYNAQIRAIESALSARGIAGIKIGTVDKFQGRQAPVVIYSMASSSAEVAPRGMEFLYDVHRLNVATSRAQALAIIVASPGLIRVFCKTPAQMVLANGVCAAWEAAQPPGGGDTGPAGGVIRA